MNCEPQGISSKVPVLQSPRCIIDFEARSEADLRDCGAARYAQDPTTQILCMSYSFDDGEVFLWTPWVETVEEFEIQKTIGRGKNKHIETEIRREPVMVYRPDLQPFPQEVIDHVLNDGALEAHSVGMERSMWFAQLVKDFGVPPCKRWLDTQATAAYRGLPLDLDGLGAALNLDVVKDKGGKALINKLCKPRKPTKDDQRKWNNSPALFKELFAYCIQDNKAERAVGNAIGDLPPQEYRVWVLDQTINARGVAIDLPAVHAAKTLAAKATANMEGELQALTEGVVTTGNQRARIQEWLGDKHGVVLPNMQSGTLKEALKKDPNMPATPKRVLQIRQELSRTGISKLDSMLDCVCEDGRIHGLLQYHGAGTGRWAGRLVQPQNFSRPKVNGKPFKGDVEDLIKIILFTEPEIVRLCYGPEMETLTAALRSMFVPKDGYVYDVADYSQIEARLVLWLAGHTEAMDIFRASDRKEGPDIYCFSASELFGRKVTKDDAEDRQLGKIQVLSSGYGCGAGRLVEIAHDDYELDLSPDMANKMVQGYRTKFDKVPKLWRGLENAACQAVITGRPCEYKGIVYEVVKDAAGKWLTCRLLSGRRLWYYEPSITYEPMPWSTKEKPDIRPKLWFWGRDSKKGGMWSKVSTYGGMLTADVIQAMARCLMVAAMFRVEALGYPIILTIHDEVISETPEGHGSHAEFEHEMAKNTPWCPDMPIAVEGWRGKRLRKG